MRIAICDDDGEAVERLEALLRKELIRPDEHRIISFFFGEGVAAHLSAGQPFRFDFLEAGMKGLSGAGSCAANSGVGWASDAGVCIGLSRVYAEGF